ncbi:hypothetical protein DFJ77DRAFT_448568 [Powellomyces hirtus]|nr:hypothetical protein DFJ77DRAFT_448568 [Powellomyces hirtus]
MLTIAGLLESLPSDGNWQDEHFHALETFFGPSKAIAALNLVDRRRVTQVEGPAGRTFFQVEDFQKQTFSCFPMIPFCKCNHQRVHSVCHHVLAVHLAVKMNRHVHVKWQDKHFLNFVSKGSCQ